MEFIFMYIFTCIGIAVTVTAIGIAICKLFDKLILKGRRPEKHWKCDKNTYEWLGKWGA